MGTKCNSCLNGYMLQLANGELECEECGHIKKPSSIDHVPTLEYQDEDEGRRASYVRTSLNTQHRTRR